ncbi:MAG: AAA family ATPase [Bacteroidales bacterium]|nr:AAA family ATPase [Candidatus Colimorpha onthohippi]
MENSVSHLQRLTELLQLEMAYEKEAYSHAISPHHISGRLHEGGCHYPINIVGHHYNPLGKLILDITYQATEEELFDNDSDFEPGKTVNFFYLNGDETSLLSYNCFIERVQDQTIEIKLPGQHALDAILSNAKLRLLGIQLGIDTTSYQVMLDALHQAATSTDSRFVSLREVLIGSAQPQFRAFSVPPIPWLNHSQNIAIQKVVSAQQIAIIHGPPGTGKTTTLVESIVEVLAHETQVLVCAPSNIAVDCISEMLTKRNVSVLRIGNPLRISDEMLACSYEHRYCDHPDYGELWNINQYLHNYSSSQGHGHDQQSHLKRLRHRQTELEIKINEDLFRQSRVIACTLIGSAYQIMERRHFSTLFIDEAAQALEPACWAAILKADRVILSGDHKQLPPTVKCVEAARQGLDRTLMQHVVSTKSSCVSLLDTQYRMNKDIMQFPSNWFYHDKLKAAPEVADRLVHIMDTPLTWIDTSTLDYSEHQVAQTPSLSNAAEARLLVLTLREYVESIGLQHFIDDRIDIGIISPYRSQVRLLRRMIKTQRLLKPLRSQISIHTVDGFQGQERDVIIISTVRDNNQQQIGFLRDLRRMNVAITRARMKLIIVGNTQTLNTHPFYHHLIQHFADNGNLIVPQENPNQ